MRRANTRKLLVEHGGFLYDSDSYSDDRPYWIEIAQKKHLVIPYSLVCNDANFLQAWALAKTFSCTSKTLSICYIGKARNALP